jgi:hypothetical protein
MYIPAGAGVSLNGDAGQVTGLMWPLSRMFFRTLVHVAFTVGDAFISRDAVSGWEMVLQGMTESLQAFLFTRFLANVAPDDYAQNTGRFYGAVLTTELLMQVVLVGIQMGGLNRLARQRNYDFLSTELFVTFDGVEDLVDAGTLRSRLRTRFRQSLSSGAFYALVYFTSLYLANTFTASDNTGQNANLRRWNSFSAFFFVLRNFLGYYQFSSIEKKAWSKTRRSKHVQRIRGAIPMGGPPTVVVIPTVNYRPMLEYSDMAHSSISSVQSNIQNSSNLNSGEPIGEDEEEKEDENEDEPLVPTASTGRHTLADLFGDELYLQGLSLGNLGKKE